MSAADLRILLGEIVGQRCENTTNAHGSIIAFDFGPLSRRADEPPTAKAHGWRHLTVLSPWRLQKEHEVLCDWNMTGATIAPALAVLHGARVVAATSAPPGWDLSIRWSNGMELLVFGDSTDNRDDAWFILGTDGTEAGATPVYRNNASN